MTAATLTGKRCQCAACGECFSRTRAFDRHRVGDCAKRGQWQGARRCLGVPEMLARGMRRNAAGLWIVDCRHASALAAQAASGTLPATPLPDATRKAADCDNAVRHVAIAGEGA